MWIHGTKKLLDRLKDQPEIPMEQGASADPFSWHANLIRLNRRQTVVLMHDSSEYPIILYGLKAKDLARLHEILEEAVRLVWRKEGIKKSVIDCYISEGAQREFGKTKNRSLVARLNKLCQEIHFFEDYIDEHRIIQTDLSFKLGRRITGVANKDYLQPIEKLYPQLQPFSAEDGENVISIRAVELNVQLSMEETEITRRLIVPLNRTFFQLHKILQTAFHWQDYHLHEFYILDWKTSGVDCSINHPAYTEEGAKAIINLVSNEEVFDYPNDIPMKSEKGVTLSDYIPACKRLMYVYDFGDDWRLQIDVVRVIEDASYNYPFCLDGLGDAPPEDVGGERGYLEFLEILNNPEDPDYDYTKQWARGQLYHSFDRDFINMMLRDQ